MAMSKTYYTVEGQVWGEHRSGEADSRDYLHDALGNVVAVFQNGWEIAEAFYKPHGEFAGQWNFLAHGYRFAWVGAHGYRRTNMAYMTHYIRARHYSQIGANWTTRDPLWPREMPYGYVEGRVMRAVDPSGMNKVNTFLSRLPSLPKDSIQCNDEWNKFVYDYCNECARLPIYLHHTCEENCNKYANDYFNECDKLNQFDPVFPRWPWPFPRLKPPGKWVPLNGPLGPPSVIVPYIPPCPPAPSVPSKSASQVLFDDCIERGAPEWWCWLLRAVDRTVRFRGGG